MKSKQSLGENCLDQATFPKKVLLNKGTCTTRSRSSALLCRAFCWLSFFMGSSS